MLNTPDPAPAKPAREIPCPAKGDQIVFTPDVAGWMQSSSLRVVCKWCENEVPFCVLDAGNDVMQFVVEGGQETRRFKLTSPCPGFDYTSFWQAECEEVEAPFFICVHYPVSGRKPIPDVCVPFFVPATIRGRMLKTYIVAYDMRHRTTLAKWRAHLDFPIPMLVFEKLEAVAATMNALVATGHNEMRISADNIILDDNGSVRFLGVAALDMPWSERCAQTYYQDARVAVPPECTGYMLKQITPIQSVYVLGTIAYYLITGTQPPVCEAMDYEIALLPRAFVPEFPIGWDEIINRALCPNPELRYHTPDEFIKALAVGLDMMTKRHDSKGPFKYDVAIDTHIGVGKRLRCPVNQDAVFLKKSSDGQRILLVVGDGVSTSTYGSGDIASGLLVETAERIWNESIVNARDIDPKTLVCQIMAQSNQAICQYIRDRYADKSPTSAECMGTTALIAIVENGIFTLASIGDSRAYLIRNDLMACITRDHNLFTVGIINGLAVDLCANHPHAGSLVQCLGYYDDNEPEHEELAFDVYTMHLMQDDNILLTTDGILDYIDCEIGVSEAKIAESVLGHDSASEACMDMIIQANLGGGGDNCGVGLIRVLNAK